MQIPLVMTIIGPDRTGLVESVARAVAEHGGNWLESRMCRLGGEFAGILRIEIPAEKKSALLAALQKISGLTVTIRAGESKNVPANARQTKLEIVGTTARASSTKSPARCPGGRERRGIFQRSRQRAHVRRNIVQSARLQLPEALRTSPR